MVYSIELTPRCFRGPHLPINMFSSKHPNDQMSTAVVYNTSYGPAITRCIDTYSNIPWYVLPKLTKHLIKN